MALIFAAIGGGMLLWSSQISEPSFVFPLGVVAPEIARPFTAAFGVAALVYLASLSYVRFVRRPKIVLGKSKIELPTGELGLGLQVIRRRDLVGFAEGKTAGGWRHLRIVYQDGAVTLSAAQLPDDEAFDRVRAHLTSLLASSNAVVAEAPTSPGLF